MESNKETEIEENQVSDSETTAVTTVEEAPQMSPEAAFGDSEGGLEQAEDETGASTESSFPTLKEETVQPLGVSDVTETADDGSATAAEKSDSPFVDPDLTRLESGTAREEDEEKAKPKAPRGKRARWYIIHTYSGHENKVKINLDRRIESMNMAHKIFRVEVPQKTVTKIKDGKRQEKEERLFPGYVLVEMLMDDDSWYVVRHTPGVTKFVGSEKKPVPARDAEIKRILFRSVPTTEKVEIDLKVGENIRIISGPFAEFEGTVTEVSPEKGKIKASVSIFGRDTPVELVFNQVQKL